MAKDVWNQKCNFWGSIRDENGGWISEYNRYLGKCSIFDIKLWGVLEGLKLSQSRGHDKIIIQSDSLEVVKAIQGNISTTSNLAFVR
ncbi:hypothetical protein PVK06_016853 [Gossypium arboreum]|uniref:RNase H type-1 domain-containing protein n=1 Tax=Gossypium arboreum TaxID=29729 RepID=A0ABR0Q215_GOSAR|nr:hypothetical protein PVK06_016853 [Gossypium arboreum]